MTKYIIATKVFLTILIILLLAAVGISFYVVMRHLPLIRMLWCMWTGYISAKVLIQIWTWKPTQKKEVE